MNTRHMILLASVALSLLIALPAKNAHAQLELNLSLDKTEYILGEPIIAYVSIKNIGSASHKIPENFEPDFMSIRYYIRKESEDEKKFTPWAFLESDTNLRSIGPGQIAVGTAKIFYGADGWTFSKPGKYLIRAGYRSYTSPIFSVEIKHPASKKEEEAARLLLDSKEAGYFLLFEGGDHLKEGMGRLNDLSTKFPDSLLSGYANFALGANQATEYADYATKSLRKANPGKAEQFFDRSRDNLEKSSAFYYSSKALDGLSDIRKMKGDLDGAQMLKNQLEKDLGKRISPMKDLAPDFIDSVRKQSLMKEKSQ